MAAQRALEQRAFDQAAAFFSQALEIAEDLDEPRARRGALMIRLGAAQRMAAQPQYRETLLHAAELASELGDADLLAEAALTNTRGQWSSAGEVDTERVRTLEAALTAVGHEDSSVRAKLLVQLGVEIFWHDPDLRRLEYADEALAMARRLGDEACSLAVLTSRQIACWTPDRVPELVAELSELVPLVERIGGAVDLAYALGWGCIHALDMADVMGTAEMVESLVAIAEDSSNPALRWLAAVYHCGHIQAVGTGDDVETTATEALARVKRPTNPTPSSGTPHSCSPPG